MGSCLQGQRQLWGQSGQSFAEDAAVALHGFYWGHSLSLSTGLLQEEVPGLGGLWQLLPWRLRGVPRAVGTARGRSRQLAEDRLARYRTEPREGSAFWLGTAQTACLHGDLPSRGTATHSGTDTRPFGRARRAPRSQRCANESQGNGSSPSCPKQKEKNKLKC